jgi:signal peptidase I
MESLPAAAPVRQPPPARRTRRRAWPWLLLAFVGFVAVAGFLGLLVIFKTYKIPASSMEPTLQVGDLVFVSRWSFLFRDPRRGEVVVFTAPENSRIDLIKRVVGIPGDWIEIRAKRLFVNGQAVEEPYIEHRDPVVFSPDAPGPASSRDHFGPLVVQEGQYFVLGDNRDNSYDSRFYGPVPRELMRHGEPMFVYFSIDSESGAIRWERTGRAVR